MIKLVIIPFFFSLAFLSNIAFSLELTVDIQKVKALDKKIMLELFFLTDEKSQHWGDIQLVEKKVVEFNSKLTFSHLDEGWYAIRVFQDINNNGILDKSTSDIPIEPVGFSANPSLFGGEPSPKDSAIMLVSDMIVSISLKHRKVRKKRKKFH